MKDRVHPKLLGVLESFPEIEYNLDNLKEIRALSAQALPEKLTDNSLYITEEVIKGPDGSDLSLRIYTPKSIKDDSPVLLWIHGGGYITGSALENDVLCSKFSKEINCKIISVDYRLAPEYPYPAAIEDCYSALKWVADNSTYLNIDKNLIGIAGMSAGGGLTAALSLLTRDRGYPNICFQMPLYPMLDYQNNTASANEIKEGFIWNQKSNEFGWKSYLGNLYGDSHISSYASPAYATDYSNLPPTYTCVGQLDPFRSETINYVKNLTEAGVDVEFHLYPGAFHGFELLVPEADISEHVWSDYIRVAKFAFKN